MSEFHDNWSLGAHRGGMGRGRDTVGRTTLAAFALAVTVVVLVPHAQTLPQHGDEAQYGWSAAYFGRRVAALDFRPWGADGPEPYSGPLVDPGWSPDSWWALTQPMGARLLYAAALGALRLDVPIVPFSYEDTRYQETDNYLPPATLLALRYEAILCAALGFALLAARLGWPRGAALLLVLLIPHARDDLARAWAEGPLMLGIGLVALTWRTRWFGVACGLAAAFKLTGLGLWPLLLWPGTSGTGRLARLLGVAIALATWCLVTPPSWFGGGPLFLITMMVHRGIAYHDQAQLLVFGDNLPFPPRYLLPAELLALFVASEIATRTLGRWHPHDGRRRPIVLADPGPVV